MLGGWVERALDRLCSLQLAAGGWSYQPAGAAAVEPTALAGLALLACAAVPTPALAGRALNASADWLAGLQQPDGSLGISATLSAPGWPTPYAILLWAALGVHSQAQQRAAAWLLAQQGTTVRGPSDGVIGHDASLAGWSWVADTHSWVEPTALAILALRRLGLSTHPRTREGLRLIQDRAVASGGWNYGNTIVFGRMLRPQPAPTGIALLALAGDGRPASQVDRATNYLLDTLPSTRSPLSLGWGLLGLRAWGREPANAPDWLAESAARALGRPDAAPKLALLLLAAGERSIATLGLDALHDRIPVTH
jgi:hypothetical protein